MNKVTLCRDCQHWHWRGTFDLDGYDRTRSPEDGWTDGVCSVLKDSEHKNSDENTTPDKKSKNNAKMKDLMMIKTQSGKSGVSAMTKEASEFSDAVKPNMESVRVSRLHKHIFRPNDTETGDE